jgi:hypothetical protein
MLLNKRLYLDCLYNFFSETFLILRIIAHDIMVWYIFNCNWVDTRWQCYSTHLQTNNTQNTENWTYITVKKLNTHSNQKMCTNFRINVSWWKDWLNEEVYKFYIKKNWQDETTHVYSNKRTRPPHCTSCEEFTTMSEYERYIFRHFLHWNRDGL